MALTLYYHPLASYCHKVLIALYEHGQDFVPRLIDLGSEDDCAALDAVWPLRKFPVLQDAQRQRTVAESSIIIEYLDQLEAGPVRLIPQDRSEALDVRLWDRMFDHHVQGPMQAIVADKIAGAGGDLERHRAALLTVYRLIDRQAALQEWIAGAQFSMADCAAAPALFYAATLVPFPADAPHLTAYADRLMARPSVRRVLEEARPYFHMYPFAESLDPRYR